MEDEEEFIIFDDESEEGETTKTLSTVEYLRSYEKKLKKQQILIYNVSNKPISALKNIRKKAKTAVEETGVNIAYISFGLIHWTEDENSQYVMRAPILLAPITIENESSVEVNPKSWTKIKFNLLMTSSVFHRTCFQFRYNSFIVVIFYIFV